MRVSAGPFLVVLTLSLGCGRGSSAPPPAEPAPAAVPEPTPVTEVGAVPATSTGYAECDAYLVMGDKLAACPTMPAEARDAQRQAMVEMRESFASLAEGGEVPPDARAQIVEGCVQAAQAITEAYHAAGCDEDRD